MSIEFYLNHTTVCILAYVVLLQPLNIRRMLKHLVMCQNSSFVIRNTFGKKGDTITCKCSDHNRKTIYCFKVLLYNEVCEFDFLKDLTL